MRSRAAEVLRGSRWLPLAALAALALALRLTGLGAKSLWVDEAYAAGLMDMGIPDLVRMSVSGSPHPPLAFLVIRLSAAIFGTGEAGLRALSAIASALAVVPLTALVSRRLGMRAAVFGGAAWALSPYAVSIGQEAWLYGITALLGFLLLDVCDRAWRGSRAAAWALVPLALCGMLVQHLFAIYVAAGFGLYLAVPRPKRVRLRRPLLLAGALAAVYAPFAPLLLEQAGMRAERMRRAGMDMAAVYSHRYLFRLPTVYTRLIPDGLLVDPGGHLLGDLKQLAFWAFFGLLNVYLLVCLLLERGLRRPMKVWLVCVLAVPALLFIREDPTVRHLTVLWVPLCFGIAAAFRRWRPGAVLAVAGAAVMLLPYYNVKTFPYHRADWRGAVALVEDDLEDEEGILVVGQLSGGLAWDYYSVTDHPRSALWGEAPYAPNRLERSRTAEAAMDSMRRHHSRVWVVVNSWGGPPVDSLFEDATVLLDRRVSPAMRVVHLSFGH
jgi:4-amino-4-deoxy-L-arabinose transferase-like glycosyltransferase